MRLKFDMLCLMVLVCPVLMIHNLAGLVCYLQLILLVSGITPRKWTLQSVYLVGQLVQCDTNQQTRWHTVNQCLPSVNA